jgi:hypothetical protein
MPHASHFGELLGKSFELAKKHFDRGFLKSELFLERTIPKERQQWFQQELKYIFETLIRSNIKDNLINLFAGYLIDATFLNIPSLPILFIAADQYLSAIKVGFIRKGVTLGQQCNFNSNGLKLSRYGMVKVFVSLAIQENKPLSQSQATLLDKDIFSIRLLCIWAATFPMAYMLFFFFSLCYHAGWGGEAARIRWSNVSIVNPSEWDDDKETV